MVVMIRNSKTGKFVGKKLDNLKAPAPVKKVAKKVAEKVMGGAPQQNVLQGLAENYYAKAPEGKSKTYYVVNLRRIVTMLKDADVIDEYVKKDGRVVPSASKLTRDDMRKLIDAVDNGRVLKDATDADAKRAGGAEATTTDEEPQAPDPSAAASAPPEDTSAAVAPEVQTPAPVTPETPVTPGLEDVVSPGPALSAAQDIIDELRTQVTTPAETAGNLATTNAEQDEAERLERMQATQRQAQEVIAEIKALQDEVRKNEEARNEVTQKREEARLGPVTSDLDTQLQAAADDDGDFEFEDEDDEDIEAFADDMADRKNFPNIQKGLAEEEDRAGVQFLEDRFGEDDDDDDDDGDDDDDDFENALQRVDTGAYASEDLLLPERTPGIDAATRTERVPFSETYPSVASMASGRFPTPGTRSYRVNVVEPQTRGLRGIQDERFGRSGVPENQFVPDNWQDYYAGLSSAQKQRYRSQFTALARTREDLELLNAGDDKVVQLTPPYQAQAIPSRRIYWKWQQ